MRRKRVGVVTYLNQVLALSLSDERLKLGCREGVDEASLGDDQEQDLRAGQNGQFVCLREKMQVSRRVRRKET